MDNIEAQPKRKKHPMDESFRMFSELIKSYKPDTVDENTINSLRFMLSHPTFAPLWDVIADKLIDIGEYYRLLSERTVKTNMQGKPLNSPKKGPTSDTRKKKKKVANAGDVPEGSTPGPTLEFRTDPDTGLLIPVRK
jgi:hypothetical protein